MKKIKIACIGDSITEGYGTDNRETDCYPAVLSRILGGRAEVRNFGISGFCVLDSADCPYRDTIQYTASLRYEPDIVLFMLGTNDSKIANFAGHDNDFRNSYGRFLAVYQDLPSHPQVFALTAPASWRKNGDLFWDYMIVPEILEERIVDMQKLVASLLDCPVIDVHEWSKAQEIYFPDGIHPGTEGSRRLAEFLARQIQPTLEALEKKQNSVYEYYEWLDYWVEAVNNRDKKRILLIGDSITRGYRPYLAEKAEKEILVDQIATSASADAPEYLRNLAILLEDERLQYDLIHLNNGIHGQHMDVLTYEAHMEKIIRYIQSRSEGKLVLALSTPVDETYAENGAAQNEMIRNRNRILRKLSEKYHLPLDALSEISLEAKDIYVGDGIHYNEKGCTLQAEQVLRVIRENL